MQNQYKLCLEIIRRLHKADILNQLIIIGSWCMYFYKYYFNKKEYTSTIRTRDIDFLVYKPTSISTKVDVTNLFKDLGFVLDFLPNGLMKLSHPELIIEFLVPERGRGSDKPIPIKNLGVNAQALRYLDLLQDHIVTVIFDGITLSLPHPAAFALHKVIISGRRKKREKADKDLTNALNIMHFMVDFGLFVEIRGIFDNLPSKWQRTILKILNKANETEIVKLLRKQPHLT